MLKIAIPSGSIDEQALFSEKCPEDGRGPVHIGYVAQVNTGGDPAGTGKRIPIAGGIFTGIGDGFPAAVYADIGGADRGQPGSNSVSVPES